MDINEYVFGTVAHARAAEVSRAAELARLLRAADVQSGPGPLAWTGGLSRLLGLLRSRAAVVWPSTTGV
jgi:hypothetical protein